MLLLLFHHHFFKFSRLFLSFWMKVICHFQFNVMLLTGFALLTGYFGSNHYDWDEVRLLVLIWLLLSHICHCVCVHVCLCVCVCVSLTFMLLCKVSVSFIDVLIFASVFAVRSMSDSVGMRSCRELMPMVSDRHSRSNRKDNADIDRLTAGVIFLVNFYSEFLDFNWANYKWNGMSMGFESPNVIFRVQILRRLNFYFLMFFLLNIFFLSFGVGRFIKRFFHLGDISIRFNENKIIFTFLLIVLTPFGFCLCLYVCVCVCLCVCIVWVV